jgi:hypothetical protein
VQFFKQIELTPLSNKLNFSVSGVFCDFLTHSSTGAKVKNDFDNKGFDKFSLEEKY